MTELARGEYEVAADGSFTMSLKFSGDPHHCTPEDLRRSSFPTTESYAKFLDGLGYKRRDTIGPFGSGSVLTTSGDKIVGREEPAGDDYDEADDWRAFGSGPAKTLGALLQGVLDRGIRKACPEPIRPALTWRTETPFDPFKGYESFACGPVDGMPIDEVRHPLQRLNDGGPVNGSAFLLKTA